MDCLADEEKFEAFELRSLVEEQMHQIKHLQRSQLELLAALAETPGDADFLDAFTDNERVLISKNEKVERLKAALRRKDPSFEYSEAEKPAPGFLSNRTVAVHIELGTSQAERVPASAATINQSSSPTSLAPTGTSAVMSPSLATTEGVEDGLYL